MLVSRRIKIPMTVPGGRMSRGVRRTNANKERAGRNRHRKVDSSPHSLLVTCSWLLRIGLLLRHRPLALAHLVPDRRLRTNHHRAGAALALDLGLRLGGEVV